MDFSDRSEVWAASRTGHFLIKSYPFFEINSTDLTLRSHIGGTPRSSLTTPSNNVTPAPRYGAQASTGLNAFTQTTMQSSLPINAASSVDGSSSIPFYTFTRTESSTTNLLGFNFVGSFLSNPSGYTSGLIGRGYSVLAIPSGDYEYNVNLNFSVSGNVNSRATSEITGFNGVIAGSSFSFIYSDTPDLSPSEFKSVSVPVNTNENTGLILRYLAVTGTQPNVSYLADWTVITLRHRPIVSVGVDKSRKYVCIEHFDSTTRQFQFDYITLSSSVESTQSTTYPSVPTPNSNDESHPFIFKKLDPGANDADKGLSSKIIESPDYIQKGNVISLDFQSVDLTGIGPVDVEKFVDGASVGAIQVNGLGLTPSKVLAVVG